ncbi:unnamed protein product [Cochlearia groenlandica]
MSSTMSLVQEILTPRSLEFEQRKVANCETKISSLPDDLIVELLKHVPTKHVVTTMVLSKRWLFLWTLVPKLEYKESSDRSKDDDDSVLLFLNKLLELHNAPILETLRIHLHRRCFDLGKWVASAVDRHACLIEIEVFGSAKLTILPMRLFISKTLVELILSRKILVEVPSSASLPSLRKLTLLFVVYKEEDSLARLLSSCPDFTRENIRLYISDVWREDCSIDSMSRYTKSSIVIFCYESDKFLTSLPSVTFILSCLKIPNVMKYRGITFSRLRHFYLRKVSDNWPNLLLIILKNSPKLEFLHIGSVSKQDLRNLRVLWNQPNFVPLCLSSRLESFECREYQASGDERDVVAYILANSKCLKTAKIYIRSNFSLEERQKLVDELESMSRVSKTCALIIT